MRSVRHLIIGDQDDPHVIAVANNLDGRHTLVIDAARMKDLRFTMSDSHVDIDDGVEIYEIGVNPVRAWLRRLAPDDWSRGILAGSAAAAANSAWLTLLASLMRLGQLQWMSPVDSVLVAENKLLQLQTARKLGIPIPKTVVSNDPDRIKELLGHDLILKPLGVAHFFDAEEPRVIFAQALTDEVREALRTGPPFLVQERLHATEHLRIVAVLGVVVGCSLDARELPLDWRTDAAAHTSFQPIAVPPIVAEQAQAINAALGITYSSQDWIVTADDAVLIDVNPNGQWLFLPEPVGSTVTTAIADWMASADG